MLALPEVVVISTENSLAFNGTKTTICVAYGAKSKLVVDLAVKQGGYDCLNGIIGGGQGVGARDGLTVGRTVGESVGEGEGPVVGEVVGRYVGRE